MAAKRTLPKPERRAASPLRRPRSLAFRKLRRGPLWAVGEQRRSQTRKAVLPAPVTSLPALPEPALPAITVSTLHPLPAEVVMPPVPVAVTPNALVLRGDYWQISFGGASSLVQDCRGLRYIAILIRDAHDSRGPIHARELVALATGQEAGPIELEGAVDVLDARARAQLLERLSEVAGQRERACAVGDLDRAAALDEEHERIGAELMRAAAPPGGRRRGAAFAGADEKARKAVSKAIGEAIDRIAGASGLAALARHLEPAIHKGLWLSYNGGAS